MCKVKAVFLDADTLTERFSIPGVDITYYPRTQESEIVERAKDAEIILTNKVQITSHTIVKLDKLKLIQITATGMNNVDLIAAEKRGVVVRNIAGYSTRSVVEHTFMMILNLLRAGTYYHNEVARKAWSRDGLFCLLEESILDLGGKNFGIVGFGSIGQGVAQIAQAFGANVLISERLGASKPRDGRVKFDEILEKCEIISFHCPLTKETENLLNDVTISKMRQKPLIINAARGAIADDAAIARAIQCGSILGYGSDVFRDEPIKDDNPLLELSSHPRVFLTPHNAWASENAQKKLLEILIAQVQEFAAGLA